MSKRAKVTICIAVGLSMVIVIGLLTMRRAVRSFFYPAPPPMPAQVDETMQSPTGQLEALLQTKAPKVLPSLNPGLSEERILELEHNSGITLPEDMRALYRWHDGQSLNISYCLIPGQRFMPLAEAIATRERLRQDVKASSTAQRVAFSIFAGHKNGWLTVFDDGAGDGHFLDIERVTEPGHFFYNMMEMNYYIFFPSVRNFIAGLVECYSKKAIWYSEEDDTMEEDYELAESIWTRFGARNAD
ncbi:MAG: SMI1/KNR4 family protein [Planctomycetota bacterium]|jgi:cell wall assembly regulator SMI1